MQLNGLTPMLWTNDLESTIRFYRDLLLFEVDEYNEEWGWCYLHKDAVSLMFCLPNEHAPYGGTPVFTGSFYIYTEEVNEAWEQLQDNAEVYYPIGNFAHNMREFAILDNNGYVLQFGRELQPGEEVDD